MPAPGFRPRELAARLDESVFARWQRARAQGELDDLAERLRELGLNERAVRHVCGVLHPLSAPGRAVHDPALRPPLADVPPAAVMTHLWVLGAHLAEGLVRARLGYDLDRLAALGLVHTDGERVAATVSMIPVAQALVVSDRADVRRGRHTASVADDSALHTIGAIPARPARPRLRWLDVGTGSAVAPLARPASAAHIVGTDINERALAMARLGAALSRVEHLDLECADLWHDHHERTPFDRITFNAPIPEGEHAETEAHATGDMPWYRYGASDILARFWSRVGALIAPEGEVLVHSVVPEDGVPPWLHGRPGRIMVARYTPPGMVPAFAMTAWQPGFETRHFIKQIVLTRTSPHITRAMLELD